MNSGKRVAEGRHQPPREGGQALKVAIHTARAKAGIASDTELAHVSRVSYDTLMNWYSGRTVPRPAMVKRVAEALGIPYAQLLDAYDGREAEPPELKEAIVILVGEIRAAMVEERRARAQLMRAVTAAIGAALDPVPVMDPEAYGPPHVPAARATIVRPR